jgi:hypothetical protein
VRASLTWQATPGTFGSSKALMQARSFLPMKRKVVLTQGKSSADDLIASAGPDYVVPEILPGIVCRECGGDLKFKLIMMPPDG